MSLSQKDLNCCHSNLNLGRELPSLQGDLLTCSPPGAQMTQEHTFCPQEAESQAAASSLGFQLEPPARLGPRAPFGLNLAAPVRVLALLERKKQVNRDLTF